MAHLPPREGLILEIYEKLQMPNEVLDYVQCLTSVDKFSSRSVYYGPIIKF